MCSPSLVTVSPCSPRSASRASWSCPASPPSPSSFPPVLTPSPAPTSHSADPHPLGPFPPQTLLWVLVNKWQALVQISLLTHSLKTFRDFEWEHVMYYICTSLCVQMIYCRCCWLVSVSDDIYWLMRTSSGPSSPCCCRGCREGAAGPGTRTCRTFRKHRTLGTVRAQRLCGLWKINVIEIR